MTYSFLCLLRESQIQLVVFSTLPERLLVFFFGFFNLKTCEKDLLVVFIACSRISLKAATFILTVAKSLFSAV